MAPDPVYIVGWKNIAAFLGVSVRTAQRWEMAAGLPVGRVAPAGGSVQARRDLLERWRELPARMPEAALPPRRPALAARAPFGAREAGGGTSWLASIYRRAVCAVRVVAHPTVLWWLARQPFDPRV